MGGCFSVSVSCDQLANHIFNCLCGEGNYVRSLEENIDALEKPTRELKAKRDDLLARIEAEGSTGRQQRLAQVEEWLSRVQTVENQVDVLLRARDAEIKRLCLCGFCSKDLVSSYCYGKDIAKMRKVVDDLISEGVFDTVIRRAPTPKVEMRPIAPTVGREDLLEMAWGRLMEDGVGILGLYGMGGVGKTTLLKQINNKFLEQRHQFDIVIWVVVSRDVQIQSIQEEIGDKLGFDSEEWNHKKGTHKKASDIQRVLTRKRFVLLLDDMWRKVDLTEIGVPFPTTENGCKVVFTTRSKEVCGRMGVDAKIEVECLAPNDALDLFRKKVGESTLGSHLDIPELAKAVAQKCKGLPLALNVIGETMASKTMVQEWHLAINVLASSAAEFSGMEDEILPILKYSYDNLIGQQIRLCFQYCALFPEDHKISKEELVNYWIGEGIIDGNELTEIAENKGYGIIGTLVRACLLMEEKGGLLVEMHDVVREMALWVASDMGKQKENFIVKAGAKLDEVPEVKNWNVVRRVSLMRNRIEEISVSPRCLELETLFLQDNKLVNISGDFFRCMPRLLVLDLSENNRLIELPEEICNLVSMQYLNLSRSGIKRLPVNFFQNLQKLMSLNLEVTQRLESIHGVSCLSSLKILRLRGSRVKVDVDVVVKELQLLEHLKDLTIEMSDASAVEQVLSDMRLASCIRRIRIYGVKLESRGLSLAATMDRLRGLRIDNCVIPEIKIEKRRERGPICFPNLREVGISYCRGMRDLTWLLYAPNLVQLSVNYCYEVEEIISKEKAEEEASHNHNSMVPFQRLKSLSLVDLTELKSIYRTPLHFPCLREIRIIECPKLRKLPLDSNSVPAADDKSLFVKTWGNKEWVNNVEWEDDATQQRFLPFFLNRL